MDIKNFTSAIMQIAEERGISSKKIIEIVETAIASAYRKEYGKKMQIIKAKLDPKSGEIKFWQIKLVVNKSMILDDEEIEALKKEKQTEKEIQKDKKEEGKKEEKIYFNPERHILLKEAKKIKKDIKLGEELETLLETKTEYGRIAAQAAKQVVLQKIKEAEREIILSEFKSKEGEIISGIVQRIDSENVFLDVGKATGILAKEEQIPRENYQSGQRLKLYILRAEQTSRGPIVLLSRAYPKFLSKLFELEVPEISTGQVLIKSIAREAGFRSKVAVVSQEETIDPIGSVIGQRGTRIMTVINELGGEKIDIVEYSEDPEKFISNSLAPAKVLEVKILPQNIALAVISDEQLSLAIGKNGQNVRLAAKLTGWKIDIRNPEAAKIQEKEMKKQAKKEKESKKEEEKKIKKKQDKKQDKKEIKKPKTTKEKKKEKKEVKEKE